MNTCERSRRIALDFDDTYTADPALWECIVARMKEAGHSVCIVSMRFAAGDNRDIERAAARMEIPWVVTDAKQKAEVYQADIWIDDMPEFIPTIAALGLMVKPDKADGPRCGACVPCRELEIMKKERRHGAAACTGRGESEIGGDLCTGALEEMSGDARVARLMLILQNYVEHKTGCPCRDGGEAECNCGLDAEVLWAMGILSGEGIEFCGRWQR